MERKRELHEPSEPQRAGGNEVESARDLFVRQVSDRALPAVQILSEQRANLEPDAPVRIFVP